MFDVNKFNAAIALKGESQEDAAAVMGMNRVTLFRKKTGVTEFTRKEIELFCKHYNVSPDIVFFTNFSA